MLSGVGVRAESDAVVADDNLDAKFSDLGLKFCPIFRFLKDDDVDLNNPDMYLDAVGGSGDLEDVIIVKRTH